MAKSPRFHWYYFQRRFAEALAALPDTEMHVDAQTLWAMYRVGLYASVTRQKQWDGHWRSGFARTVSLAACGRLDEATQLALELQSLKGAERYIPRLAGALAPFSAELSLSLLEHHEAPPALRAALLCRAGKPEAARNVIRRVRADTKMSTDPELLLVENNLEEVEPNRRLMRLNAYLDAYGLSPISLRDPLLPPAASNLTSKLSLPDSGGPLVSVLLTTYQLGDRVGQALESLSAQTYRNIEIIVADDASTDDTETVVREWMKRDPRIRYLRLACNAGTYVAKSLALRAAQGEFVTCHDSDDWSHPMKIELQAAPMIRNKGIVFTTSHWVRLQDDGFYYARPVYPYLRFNPSSPMFRRRVVLARSGVWDAVRTGADSELFTRLKLAFGPLSWRRVVQPLAFGAHRPNSLMTASDTGYSATSMPTARLDYWESWTHWHIRTLRSGNKLTMPNWIETPDAVRPFSAPEGILVSPDRIRLGCRDSA